MAELILGIGQNRTVQDIVATAVKEIRIKEGNPRKIIARSPSTELIGERTDLDKPFESFTVRGKFAANSFKEIEKLVSDHPDVFTMEEVDGVQVIHFSIANNHETKAPAADGDAKAGERLELTKQLAKSLHLPEVWRVHGEGYRVDHLSPELLFQAMVKYRASDIHLSPGQAPVFRVDNETRQSELIGPLSALQIRALIREIATDAHWEDFKEHQQTSFSYHQIGLGYSRVSCFIKNGAPHCTLRFLPENIPSFEDLRVPRSTMEELANQHHGLILVTGMTGSGKSTTVAALVDWINSNKSCHILTIEDPVEYVHRNKKAIVSQRSTGEDVADFFLAVTGALRHDPDVIVIGEMRDPDTIRSAISAAATGHLVISTLHANTASEVVNRVVSFFDPVERDLVKLQLRDCLRCVICQRLLPKEGGGRVPALEIMINDIKALNDAIVAGDTDGIRIGMQQTVSHSFLFENYIHQMYKDGVVSLENARTYCTAASTLDQMLMGTYSIPRLDAIKGHGH